MQRLGGEAMGGPWVLLSDGAVPDAAAVALVQRELDAVDQRFSPWRADSELARVNAAVPGEALELSDAFAAVLGYALRLRGLSEGAFDPTAGGEVSRAGFGPEAKPVARGEIALEGRVLTLSGPVTLDLCAVAKGYAIDRAAAALRGAGGTNFLLNVTGDLVAFGQAPGGTPWRVALELPVPEQQVVFHKTTLHGALATSGTYRNQREGGRISHLIDGRSGACVSHGLIAASVLAATAMEADGWATTLAVLGPERGAALARAQGVPARIVSQTEGGFVEQKIGVWPGREET